MSLWAISRKAPYRIFSNMPFWKAPRVPRNTSSLVFLLRSFWKTGPKKPPCPKKLLPRNKKYFSWFSLEIYSNPPLICDKQIFFWEAGKRGFPRSDSAEQFVSSSFAHFGLFINGFRNPFSDKNWLSFNEFRCFWVNWVTILFLDASFGFNLSFKFFCCSMKRTEIGEMFSFI